MAASNETVAPRRTGGRTRLDRRTIAPYLFLLPNMLLFALFTIGPALYSFYLSLFNTSPFRATRFAGFANYADLAADELFRTAVANSIVFVVAFTAVGTALSVGVALLLNSRIKARGFFRSAFFFPVVLSPVVVALVWHWILDQNSGLLNLMLEKVGIGGQPWLLDGTLAMASVVGVGIWIHLGFYALIVLAGLQAINQDLFEAARVDGATSWQETRYVTLPLLRPTILVVLILSVIAGFQAFDYIFVLTGGGPTFSTTLMVQFIYRTGFEQFRFGLAAAGAVVLFLIIFSLTMLQFIAARRGDAV